MLIMDAPPIKKQAEEAPYPLLFMSISGAHLYGFASPDSDYDLRGVHILPKEDMLGLLTPKETIEKDVVETWNGHDYEIDVVTHDAKKFFTMMLQKNGLVHENIFSPLVIQRSPAHRELQAIAPTLLTSNHAHHYHGLARSRWEKFTKTHEAKSLLYTFRGLMTGIHMMQTGKVEAHIGKLNDQHKLPYIEDLIEKKKEGGEKSMLPDADVDFFEGEYRKLVTQLDEAKAKSHLPPRVPAEARDNLNDFLIRLRLNPSTPA